MTKIKKFIKRPIRKLLDSMFRPYFNGSQSASSLPSNAGDGVTQLLLSLKYKELLANKMPLPKLKDVGFRTYSQTDEDGILLYIFSVIGTINKQAVEICAGDGIECNTANLIINHGWSTLLFEGNEERIKRGRDFYSLCKDTHIFPPAFVDAWVTAENINLLITNYGFHGEIDLLSIDMDGVDYWIWKSIDYINPRVVITEYQDVWGPDKAVTVPYDEKFNRLDIHPNYFGASLSAFTKLGKRKGYRLIGCNRLGYNAFFIRNGVGEDIFPEISLHECLEHPKVTQGREERLAEIINYKWLEV